MIDTFQAHEVQESYCDRVRSLIEQLRKFSFLAEHAEGLQRVVEEAVQPFNVAVFGRMKTGKSSLINAIIGRHLAITGVEEATATINKLSYGVGVQLNNFIVHWKDAQPETFPIEKLQDEWNGTSEDVLARVKRTSYLELYANVESLERIHIIDTPGTGSTTVDHEDVAQQFISGQEADALVYVFSPSGRETDEDALTAFRKGCLESSDPYNSIAVLHKWDHIYWNNGGDRADIRDKAARLYERMKDVVAAVVPVSAPLALLTKTASKDFWDSCLTTVFGFAKESKLKNALMQDDIWCKDTERKGLYMRAKKEYRLPWSSFQIMLRELLRAKPDNAERAGALIRELSGYDEFEKTLDAHILKHQAIIRLRQTRARAQKRLELTYSDIEKQLRDYREKLVYQERIAEEIFTPELRAWLESQIGKEKVDLRNLELSFTQIDGERYKIKDEIEIADRKLEIIRWLEVAHPTQLASVMEPLLRALDTGFLPDDEDLQDALFDCTAPLLFSTSPELREKAEMLDDIVKNLKLPSEDNNREKTD